MKYCFHPIAETEHLEAIKFYESKRIGLGLSYLTEFEETMNQVCLSPNRYPVEMEPDIRHKILKRFPFTILFRIAEDSIQVLAVAHYRRNSNYWLDRR